MDAAAKEIWKELASNKMTATAELNIQLTIQFNPSSSAEDDEAQRERPVMIHWATHESVE
jgi:hypothetical protein